MPSENLGFDRWKTGLIVPAIALGLLVLTLAAVPWVTRGAGSLEIAKDAPLVVDAGSVLTYTITVTNSTGSVASDLHVFDWVPAWTRYVPSSMSAQAGVLTPTEPAAITPGYGMTWTIDSLADEASISMTFQVTVGVPLISGTKIVNTAQVGSVLDTVTTTVQGTPILTVTKSVTPTRVRSGDWVTYTIVLTNSGNGVATDVTVKDTLPSGFLPNHKTWMWLTVEDVLILTLPTQAPLAAGTYSNLVTVTYGTDTAYTGATAPVVVQAYEGYLPMVVRNYPLPPPAWHSGAGTAGLRIYNVGTCSSICGLLYAATRDQGIYLSQDGGRNWIPRGLNGTTAYWVSVTPGACAVAYAATWGLGVQKTVDAGLHWTQANTGLGDLYLNTVVVAPDGQTLYAGTASKGVYKSVNAGISWLPKSSGLPSSAISSLIVDPASPQVIYAGTWGGGVYKSVNGGDSWSPVNNGLGDMEIYSLTLDPNNAQVIYAATYEQGVFRSSNGGFSWLLSGLAGRVAYTVATGEDSVVYAGTDGSVDGQGVHMRSTTGTWSVMPEQPGSAPIVLSLGLCDSVVQAGTTDGAWWYGVD